MEILLFWIAVVAAAALLVRLGRRRAVGWLAALTLLGSAAVAQGTWSARRADRDVADAARRAIVPEKAPSGGYIGSDTCKACHPDQYQTWHDSFHRTMTQLATPEAIKGDFNGQTLHAPDGRAWVLERRGDDFFADVEGEGPRRIEMVTGSHNMQAYWVRGGGGNELLEFPFTYLLHDKQWVGRRDVFLIDSDYPKGTSAWNRVCIECHALRGEPRLDPQTGVPRSKIVELGISCESCHGPARSHVAANQDPLRRFMLHASGGNDPTIVNPAKLPAQRSAQVCGQCHSIACNLPGWRWNGLVYQPGQDLDARKPLVRLGHLDESPCKELIDADPHFAESRFWSDGMTRVGGREYSALVQSPCWKGKNLSCGTCHSPHRGSPTYQVSPEALGDKACTQCHADMAPDDRAIAAHTHHAAGSAGSSCEGCHMPYVVYGLLKGIRQHQVSSPDVKTTLETGRPNACNLCHLDRSLAWTADRLATWYGKKSPTLPDADRTTARAVLDLATGDPGVRAITAWHMSYPPAQKASGTDWMAPQLAQLLGDDYATVRYIANRSLISIGALEPGAFDYVSAASDRADVASRVVAAWLRGRGGRSANARVLIGPDGAFDQTAWAALRGRRRDQKLFLAE